MEKVMMVETEGWQQLIELMTSQLQRTYRSLLVDLMGGSVTTSLEKEGPLSWLQTEIVVILPKNCPNKSGWVHLEKAGCFL